MKVADNGFRGRRTKSAVKQLASRYLPMQFDIQHRNRRRSLNRLEIS